MTVWQDEAGLHSVHQVTPEMAQWCAEQEQRERKAWADLEEECRQLHDWNLKNAETANW